VKEPLVVAYSSDPETSMILAVTVPLGILVVISVIINIVLCCTINRRMARNMRAQHFYELVNGSGKQDEKV
jgi:hypothetical protein